MDCKLVIKKRKWFIPGMKLLLQDDGNVSRVDRNVIELQKVVYEYRMWTMHFETP